MNDDFNAVGARLAPDIVAFFERIDLAGLAPPQDQRRGRPQGPQEHLRVAPEQSKCKAIEAELDSILESAGAAKARGRPKGALSASTKKILKAYSQLGKPAINNKVCADIAKKLKLEPETNTDAARAKVCKQIYATLYRYTRNSSGSTT
jgi:hypothetical protein